MLKKIAVASLTALIGFSGAAIAADMPAKAPVLSKAPVSLWDGLYVGVHGGYASGDADVAIVGLPGSGSPKGGFGGFQVGYNYMLTPNWLIGTEVDASFGDINDSTPPFPSSNFKIDSFGTIRGRLGYALGPWLFYGTAGTAWARAEEKLGALLRTDRTQVGWTGGVGVEYAFSRNWSAKAEYLYADFGEARRNLPLTGQVNTDVTLNMVRVGLNYRFGGFGDVAQASAMPFKAPAGTVAGWTGSYIGVHGGFGSGNLHSRTAGIGTVTANLDPDGGFGGIQAGYNWQFAPNWVIGLETDSSWGSLKDSGGGNRAKIDEMATARGRLGYAINNLLVYGTGGLALAHVESTTVGPVISDYYMLGWTAGAGVEYKFAPRWSAKVEYAYTDFGSVDETGPVLTFHDKLDVHTIKVGLNYHASLLGLLFR